MPWRLAIREASASSKASTVIARSFPLTPFAPETRYGWAKRRRMFMMISTRQSKFALRRGKTRVGQRFGLTGKGAREEGQCGVDKSRCPDSIVSQPTQAYARYQRTDTAKIRGVEK